MAKVQILLLNWNAWHDTLECLHSIIGLEYLDYQIIVVDNGSEDDSVRQIREEYPNLKIIKNEDNLGFGGGCNVGIRYALEQGAEFVWLLNNDTQVDPGALGAMVRLANSDHRVAAVGSVLYYMDSPTQVQAWGGGRVNLWTGLSKHFHAQADDCKFHYLTAASLLLRLEALQHVGLFDERMFFMYWEDVDLCFRLRQAGWKLSVARDACVWHKESASLSGRKPLLDTYFGASSLRFYRRHAPLPWIPILLTTAGRFIKRALKGDWARVRAVWAGFNKGLRGPA